MAGRPVLSTLTAAILAASALALAAAPARAAEPAVVFDHRTGNEWWVEVVITGPASGSVTSAQSMDTGGPWVGLEKKSWGAWAASFHIEPGHLVKFRAMVSGSWIESCWFTHPAGVEQCGGSTTTTSTTTTTTGGGAFDATFDTVKGNEWWVEAKVAANQALAGVDARVNCGSTWHALALRDWGAWAASFNVPSGSKVDFRARSTSGATDFSQGYVWPQATLTTSCATEPVPFDATFTGVKGNEWWVQANVAASGGTLSKVDVRIDRSPWTPLTKQSWGGWAASYRATPGATLQFEAISSTGAVDLSGCYLWTTAQPIPCQADWPREGSSYRYDGHSIVHDMTRGVSEESWTNVTLTYTGGDWRSSCTEHYLRFEGGLETPKVDTTMTTVGTLSPVITPDMPVGYESTVTMPERCGMKSFAAQREPDLYHAAKLDGVVKTVAALDYRHTSEEYDGRDLDLRADRHQGLALEWSHSYADYLCECYWEASQGHVVDTNLPVGPVLSRDQQKSLTPAWPVAGSTLVYYVDSEDGSGWTNNTYVQLQYDGSAWHGTCDRWAYPPGTDPVSGSAQYSQPAVSFAPARGAAMATQGQLAAVTLPRDCRMVSETMRVLAPEAFETYALQSPESFEVHSVEAVRGDEDPDGVGDEDAWWDAEGGLLLKWNWAHAGNHFSGEVISTDAPIR